MTAVLVDLCICFISCVISLDLRMDGHVPLGELQVFLLLVSVFFYIPIFSYFGFYRSIFRYVGLQFVVTMFKALCLYGVLYFIVFSVITVPNVPRSLGILQPTFFAFAIIGSRVFIRFWLHSANKINNVSKKKRVLIYGAGSAGRQLALAINSSFEYLAVGFIDDDSQLHGQTLNGLKIENPNDVQDKVSKLKVDQIFLAIPSAIRHRRNQIISNLEGAGAVVKSMPGITDLMSGAIKVSDLKDLDLDDLLGRPFVEPDRLLLERFIKQKIILVTGAGGSIGSELCRQIYNAKPSKLLLLDHSESALYEIHQYLSKKNDLSGQAIDIVPLLASACDEIRMGHIFQTWHPNIIIHAAAYKHVSLVEQNIAEGLKNNILGALVVSRLSTQHLAENLVLVSTDKAVRPTNIMGASKRICELIFQSHFDFSTKCGSKTVICMVRFGNVLGSSGSVVPLFRSQIEKGGPITLTHERVTRYFMTIPEAAQLVLQAGSLTDGGDVFVLDMGESVRIYDLATKMINLSGLSVKDSFNPNGDIAIEVTGLSPGEKLHEELLIGGNPKKTLHPRIMKAQEEFIPWERLEILINQLLFVIDKNEIQGAIDLVREMVPDYQSEKFISDLYWLESQVKIESL